MSKRWTLKDDKFLFEFHEIGADYVASHDLGHHGKEAGTKRVKLLKERGLWEKIEAARRAEIILIAHHTLAFSKSDFDRERSVDLLEEIGEPIPAASQGEAAATKSGAVTDPGKTAAKGNCEAVTGGESAASISPQEAEAMSHYTTIGGYRGGQHEVTGSSSHPQPSAVEPVSSSTEFVYLEDVGSGA